MLLLAAIPVFLSMLKVMSWWSKKTTKSINRVMNGMFFNIYIRFGLEAYMELCLTSLMRWQNLTFNTSSEKFHSIFATVILISVILYLVFSLIFLQLRYPILNTPEAKRRYGDLHLGLETRQRTAILFPFFFMLRRILLAGVLVNWSNRSYF